MFTNSITVSFRWMQLLQLE